MNESLSMRLGVDGSSIDPALAQIQAKVAAAAQKIKSTVNNAVGGGTGPQIVGFQLKSDKAVKRQVEEIAQTLVRGGDAADVFASSAEHLAKTLKVGLGSGIAIGVGAVLVHNLMEAHAAAVKLHNEIDALTRPGATGENRSFEGIQKNFASLGEKADALRESDGEGGYAGWWHQIKQTAIHPTDVGAMFGGQTFEQREADKAQKGQLHDVDMLAQKQSRLADIEEARVRLGSHAAELLKIQAELTDKIIAAHDSYGVNGVAPIGLDRQFERQAKAQEAAEDRREQLRKNDNADAVGVMNAGADTAILGFTDKHAARKKALQDLDNEISNTEHRGSHPAVPLTPDEQEANSRHLGDLRNRRKIAGAADERADKEDAYAANDETTQTGIDQLRLNGQKDIAEQVELQFSFQKQIRAAEDEGNTTLAASLRLHMDISGEVLKRQQAIAKAGKQQAMENSKIDAATGISPDEKFAAQRARVGVAATHLDDLEHAKAPPEDIEAARAALQGAKNTVAETTKSRADRMADLMAENGAGDAKASGNTTLADKIMRERERAKELDGAPAELVPLINHKFDLRGDEADAAEHALGPQQRQALARQQRAKGRGVHSATSRRLDRDARGVDEHGVAHGGDSHHGGKSHFDLGGAARGGARGAAREIHLGPGGQGGMEKLLSDANGILNDIRTELRNDVGGASYR